MTPPLPEAAVRFRERVLDALDRVDANAFGYINADTCTAACPLCKGILGVHFAGYAARVDVTCLSGCDDDELREAVLRLARKEPA